MKEMVKTEFICFLFALRMLFIIFVRKSEILKKIIATTAVSMTSLFFATKALFVSMWLKWLCSYYYTHRK